MEFIVIDYSRIHAVCCVTKSKDLHYKEQKIDVL